MALHLIAIVYVPRVSLNESVAQIFRTPLEGLGKGARQIPDSKNQSAPRASPFSDSVVRTRDPIHSRPLINWPSSQGTLTRPRWSLRGHACAVTRLSREAGTEDWRRIGAGCRLTPAHRLCGSVLSPSLATRPAPPVAAACMVTSWGGGEQLEQTCPPPAADFSVEPFQEEFLDRGAAAVGGGASFSCSSAAGCKMPVGVICCGRATKFCGSPLWRACCPTRQWRRFLQVVSSPRMAPCPPPPPV